MYVQPHMLPPREQPRSNWLPWLFAGGALVLGFFMFVTVVGLIVIFYVTQDRVPEGVSVAGIDLSKKTYDDAAAYLSQQAASLNTTITATDADRSWTVALRDLGVTINAAATMQQVENAAASTTIQPVYAIDLNQTVQGLIALSAQTNIEAIPGRPPQIGRDLDIEYMLERLRLDVNREIGDGVLDLTMVEVQPPEITALEAYTGVRTTHIVERGQELALIAKEYGVSVADIVALNEIEDPNLIFIGQELIIPAAGVYTPSADEAPPAPLADGKAIVVSTQEQRIYAYEDGKLVRSHIVSTGRSETPTVLGDYKVYVKYEADDMSGPDYFLPAVPYTMYFHRGYAIHGAYWHNSFGRPMSHGCVNLPVDEAEWFFNFAEVGTLVRVI